MVLDNERKQEKTDAHDDTLDGVRQSDAAQSTDPFKHEDDEHNNEHSVWIIWMNAKDRVEGRLDG